MDVATLHRDVRHNYIVRELEQTPADKRAAEAPRLLRAFDHPRCHEIPRLELGIDSFACLMPDRKKYNDWRTYCRDVFRYVLDLPLREDDRAWIKNHFVAEMDRRDKICQKLYDVEKRLRARGGTLRRLPSHCIPPYALDWKKTIIGDEGDRPFEGGTLADLDITTRLLGMGAFGDVYLARGKDGHEYALKLFHPESLQVRWGNTERLGVTNHRLVNNVRGLSGMLNASGMFARYVAFCAEQGWSGNDAWYISDRVRGISATKHIRRHPPQDAVTQECVRAYASVLRHLHNNALIMCDNHWSHIIVTPDKKCTFIDADMITREGGDWVLRANGKGYFCEEFIHEYPEPTMTGDLESFALMLDHVYNPGNGWIRMDSDRTFARLKTKRPPYTKERATTLPAPLREIVRDLVNRPRNDTITIDDVCAAIEKI